MALSGNQKTRTSPGGAGAAYLGFVAKETALGIIGYLESSLAVATALSTSLGIANALSSTTRILE